MQELDIGNNQLTALPESFETLAALTLCTLQENQLTVLPVGVVRMLLVMALTGREINI